MGLGSSGCEFGMSFLGHIIMMVLWIGMLAGVIFLIRWLFDKG